MSRHVESPDFDRMAEDRQIAKEVAADRAEIVRQRVAMETARNLIGAINDMASAAVKASNINMAWHVLDDNLRGRGR